MIVYLVNFDNGYDYSDHEVYTCGIFDSFEKAEKFCLNKNYDKTEIKGFYKKKHEYRYYTDCYYSLSIEEVEMNSEINVTYET